MKSTAKTIERRQVELHIEVEPNEFDDAKAKAFRSFAGRVQVPGFRKGKAPPHIAEQHIGREAIVDEAIERLFPELYQQALETHNIQPIMTPNVELKQREPPTFIAIVPLAPAIDLGDYRSVRIAHEEVSVTDEHVHSALDQIRESQAVLVPVERALQFGDYALLDVHVDVDGQALLDHKGVTYEVVAGGEMPVPGFPEELVGLSAGESKTFTLEIPGDFRVSEVAGKQCTCTVTMQQVRQKELPELGDEMARSFGFETLDVLRERVGSNLESRARDEARSKVVQAALDAIVGQGSVEFPPVLEEREIDDLLSEESRRYGYKNVEDYLRMTPRSVEQIREDLRPLAHRRIVNGLLLNRLAESEKIAINEAEVDNRVEELLSEAQDKERTRDLLASPHIREAIGDRLRTSRTLDRLVAIVTGESTAVAGSTGDSESSSEPEDE